MKIGLISDIHADLVSLEKAICILERENVDKVLCAGDLVDRGVEGDKVVQKIQELCIVTVRGNHDEILSEDGSCQISFDPKSLLLEETTTRYLKMLPFSRRYLWEKHRILLVHSTPKSNEIYLFSDTPPRTFKNIAEDAETDIIICGHTHEPMHLEYLGVHFFNPGSVCNHQSRDSNTCAVLTLPELDFEVFSIETGQITKP